MSIYTDLALEARESLPDIDGVTEEHESTASCELSRICIRDEDAAKRLGKRMGNYVTIEPQKLLERDPAAFLSVTELLQTELNKLLKPYGESASVLFCGLGNRKVTPDSLGPLTSDELLVTRHIIRHMPEAFGFPLRAVASICPGVMGSTGVETLDLIKGVCGRIKPDVIIAVDSLAARRASRIGASIQLTDAGIDPGAGVGNIRAGINSETLGVPVIAVGVPLVAYSSTILYDGISEAAKRFGLPFNEEDVLRFSNEALARGEADMIVTAKDIDVIVRDMSRIVSEGINRALFGERYEEIKSLIK